MPYKCRYCHTDDDHYHAKDCPCKGYEGLEARRRTPDGGNMMSRYKVTWECCTPSCQERQENDRYVPQAAKSWR